MNHHKRETAVVFGATGLVGSSLVKLLLNNAEYGKIKVVVRHPLALEHPELEQILLADFEKLDEIRDRLKATKYFCCIGTTIKKAGTKSAFRYIDLDIPVNIASLAEELGVSALAVVSSIGADERSSSFYLTTKGEMEKKVGEIYSGKLVILRPSLLMGAREEFRLGERVAIFFMKLLGWLFVGALKKYKGVYANDVAGAMIEAVAEVGERRIIESDEISKMARVRGKE